MFDGVSEDFLGGTGKAEDAKLQGAGIIPKLCPMERVGTETMDPNNSHQSKRELDVRAGKPGEVPSQLRTARSRRCTQ